MRIDNRHERTVAMPLEEASALLDGLASDDDQLWPKRWPPMRLDRGLEVGSAGGHGPIRYSVAEYSPGRAVLFQFDPAIGLDGTHGFRVEPVAEGVRLSHRIDAAPIGWMHLGWPAAVRWLHDALIEDAFDAVASRYEQPVHTPWSSWVRLLRRLAPRSP